MLVLNHKNAMRQYLNIRSDHTHLDRCALSSYEMASIFLETTHLTSSRSALYTA